MRATLVKNAVIFFLIAAAGTAMAIIFFVLAKNSETSKIQQRAEQIEQDVLAAKNTFNDVVDQINYSVTNALSAAVVSATSVASLFYVQPNTTFADFTKFITRSSLVTESVRAIYYFARVPATQAAAVQLRMRQSGYPNFTIRATNTIDYYPCMYVEPFSSSLLGSNFQAQTARLIALNKSRETAAAAASSRNSNLVGNKTEYGFIIYVPLYDQVIGDGRNSSLVDRNAYFRGVTGTSFRITPLIERALGNRTSLRVYIFDLDALTTNTSLLYTNVDSFLGNASVDDLPPVSSRAVTPITAADRRWLLVVDTDEFRSSVSPQERTVGPLLVLVIIMVVTVCTLIYFVDATRRQDKIQQLTLEQAAAVEAADELADNIADMKLEDIQFEDDAGPLQQKLYRIVSNLRRYRPYLPDILFAADNDSEEHLPEKATAKTGKAPLPSGLSLQSTGSMRSSKSSGTGVMYRMPGMPDRNVSHSSSSKNTIGTGGATAGGKGERMAQRTSSGMSVRQVSLVLVRVQGLQALAEESPQAAEAAANEVLGACASAIKGNQGSLTACGSNTILGTWNAASSVANHQVRACRCALEVEASLARLSPKLRLQVAVDTGPLLVGNVCASSGGIAAFHTLGTRLAALDALARLNAECGTTILITTTTYRSVQSLFVLRPADIVDLSPIADTTLDATSLKCPSSVRASAEIVYDMPAQPLQNIGQDEWMYNLSRVERSPDLERAFSNLFSGHNADALPFLKSFVLSQPDFGSRVTHLIEFCSALKTKETRYRRSAKPLW